MGDGGRDDGWSHLSKVKAVFLLPGTPFSELTEGARGMGFSVNHGRVQTEPPNSHPDDCVRDFKGRRKQRRRRKQMKPSNNFGSWESRWLRGDEK